MKKIILLAACLFSVTTTINAQEVPVKIEKPAHKEGSQRITPEQRAQKNVDDLNADVVLTEDQKTKVYTIALSHANKANEIRVKYKGQPENKEIAQKELETARKEYHQSVKALLTPEQLEKMKAKNEEAKAEKRDKPLEKTVPAK
jgi:Spy/CpxP family protein refolding chaperone